MAGGDKAVRDLTREFFRSFPDYHFCRTLAENIQEQVITYPQALQSLARKQEAQRENWETIQEKLDQRTVVQGGRRLLLKELTLRQVLQLDDEVLQEAIEFYFKHPYAHQRTWKHRWAPRWVRSFFLRVLFGHARSRRLDVNYEECFEILSLL